MEQGFEDEYQAILQNIEMAIHQVHEEHPQLTDYQVDAAIEALGRSYAREEINKPASLPKGELAKEVYEAVKLVCDWRLGRQQLVDEEEQPISIEPLTIDVILACLKRIRKSVKMWNKEAGSQGYLNYIGQFLL